MANLLFYKNPVPLNKNDHKDKKISSIGQNFMFAAKTNSVILAGVEFSEAAKEYAIVFTQAGGKVVPVAMLGLRNEENLFVDDKGGWVGRYIPSFVVDARSFLLKPGRPASRRSALTMPMKASMMMKANRCLQAKKPPRYFSRR